MWPARSGRVGDAPAASSASTVAVDDAAMATCSAGWPAGSRCVRVAAPRQRRLQHGRIAATRGEHHVRPSGVGIAGRRAKNRARRPCAGTGARRAPARRLRALLDEVAGDRILLRLHRVVHGAPATRIAQLRIEARSHQSLGLCEATAACRIEQCRVAERIDRGNAELWRATVCPGRPRARPSQPASTA